MGRIARAFVAVLALAIPSAVRSADRPGDGAVKALHRLFEDSWEYDRAVSLDLLERQIGEWLAEKR
jgi:hypothetical protein